MFENKISFQKKSSFRIAVLAALGSGLECYDFLVYGMMAKYLGDIFFSSHDPNSKIIQTFLIFAVGYMVRPLGGTILGMMADLFGRKKLFLLIMLTMAFSTCGIGLLPTYQQVGNIAPALLIVCRILQGISFGAELPNAVTLVSEHSLKQNSGRQCGLVLSGTSLGALLAAVVLIVLTALFTYEEILSNAWRIPFLLGGGVAFLSYWIRKNISETPEFLMDVGSEKREKANVFYPLIVLLKENIANILIGFGLAFFLATLIISGVYFIVYLNQYFDYDLPQIYKSMMSGLAASFFFMIFFGWISDRFSKIKILFFVLFGFGLSIVPMYKLLNAHYLYSLQIFFIIYNMWISSFYISFLSILPRLFSTNTRCTGTALVYNSAFSLASFIPMLYTYFLKYYNSPALLGVFFILSIVAALIAIIFFILRREEGGNVEESLKAGSY